MVEVGDLVSIIVLPNKPKMGIVLRTRNVDNDSEKSYALIYTIEGKRINPRFVTMDCLKLISKANCMKKNFR